MQTLKRLVGSCLMLLLLAPTLWAQRLEDFEKQVTTFSLDNGSTFIVMERHTAPVVSFLTYADVGSVNEVKGITGIAHIFEHMAFKGTSRIGTKDYEKEKAAMEKVDRIFMDLKRERWKGRRADPKRIEELEKAFQAAQEEAQQYAQSDEWEAAIERAGSGMLNAQTGADFTQYMVSLPSNKVELWMSLESERFLDPVLREFYKEKDVVMEERRLRRNNPFGRLIEDFLSIAYKAHPYGEPVIGHLSDLQTITRQEAQTWFDTHYGANNLTIAIVGDVDPREIERLARIYFGRLPVRPKPEPVETVEPKQEGERQCTLVTQAQPAIFIGYHRPDINDPDDPVFDILTDILGRGRTSRLYKKLVKEERTAVNTGAFTGLTGMKYPGLFNVYAIAAKDHTNDENAALIYAELERLKREPVTEAELEKARRRERADLIRSLNSNLGLARQLAFYHVVTGDWRNLFQRLEALEAVSAEDIMRVAKEYLVTSNRTIGRLETASQDG